MASTGGSSKQSRTRDSHSLRDAIQLAGIPDDDAKRVAGSLSTMLAKSEGFGGLLVEHKLAKHQTKPGNKRPQWHLSYQGVQAVAAWARARAGGKLKPGKGSTVHLERIIEEAKRQDASVAAAPRAAEATKSPPQALAPALPYSQSLLKLCRYFGIEPIFDGLTLNVEQVIIELARRVPDLSDKRA